MIPKIIHYCWISGEENMPDDIKQCIESWHKYLPDYEFINWNDSNFDWNICEFTKYNREQNNYAFCSDYIRFWALYNYGGIYLDSDVRVYKSFEELLSRKRIILPETVHPYTEHFEAAIIGAEKGDEAFKIVVDWYNNCTEHWTNILGEHKISPFVMRDCWKDTYSIVHVKGLDEIENNRTISVLDCNIYFRADSPLCFAQHSFKGEWCLKTTPNCFNVDDFQIFLCAHKPIVNHIPKNRHYTIIDVTGKADNSYNDNYHEVIDISQDEFTKAHNVCYGEGCAMRYLWKHPEILPNYICFGHYRRMFLDFTETGEQFITRNIDNYGAVIPKPFKHNLINKLAAFDDHIKDDIEVFINTVYDIAPEYNSAFTEFLNDPNQYLCNIFAMKKEDFLEMCEFCFKVLDEFDRRQKYKNNSDVMRKMIKNAHKRHLKCGINWQNRLQGFLLEYLTDTFYRYKFGVNNCRKGVFGVPEEIKYLYDQYSDYTYKVYVHTNNSILSMDLPKDYIYSSSEILDEKLLLLADDFCFSHSSSYGELNTMYYLYKNSDILPDYIGLNHCEKGFIDFFNELNVKNVIDKHGVIVPTLLQNTKNNKEIMYCCSQFDTELITNIIETYFPSYFDCWESILEEKYQIPNIFITTKQTFIELCDFVFGVLFKYDEIQNFKTDEDIKNYAVTEIVLLQEYLAEWLMQCFWEYKFKNPYQAETSRINVSTITPPPNKKLIISLTSYPERIKTCSRTLESIGEASLDVNCKKVFVLSLDEFPNRTKDLPIETLNIIDKYDFNIIWDEGNIKSLKKILPTYKYYHDHPILVLDDDKLYPKDWIKIFKEDSEKYPNDVIVGASHFKYIKIDNEIKCIPNDLDNIYHSLLSPYLELSDEKPANGCAGTLYPPNCFGNSHFLNRKLAMLISPHGDEDWCYIFTILNKVKQRMCSQPNIVIWGNNDCNPKALWRINGPKYYEKLMSKLYSLFALQ